MMMMNDDDVDDYVDDDIHILPDDGGPKEACHNVDTK